MCAKTVDGFPIITSISFIPDVIEPPINQWSSGKTIKIDVDDMIYRPIQRTINWKGQSDTVYDYELFQMIIRSWMDGDRNSKPMTKEEALDLWFSMV